MGGNLYGPRYLGFYRGNNYTNINVTNYNGFANYNWRLNNSCGLGLYNYQYGGGMYNFGNWWTPPTFREQAFYALGDALGTGLGMWAGYKAQQRLTETDEDREIREADQKEHQINKLKLTNPQTVQDGENEYTYYYSEKTGYYYRYDVSSNSFVKEKSIKSIDGGVKVYFQEGEKKENIEKP